MTWQSHRSGIEDTLDREYLRLQDEEKPRSRKILSIPLKVLVIFILIGTFFKLQHYPGASYFLSVGYLGILVVYPFRFAWKNPIRIKDWFKLIFICTWMINRYMKIVHHYELPYSWILVVSASLLWLMLEGVDYFYYRYWEYPRPRLLGWLVSGNILIFFGALIKLQHYPFSGIVLSAGFLLTIAWLGKAIPGLIKAKLFGKNSRVQ